MVSFTLDTVKFLLIYILILFLIVPWQDKGILDFSFDYVCILNDSLEGD